MICRSLHPYLDVDKELTWYTYNDTASGSSVLSSIFDFADAQNIESSETPPTHVAFVDPIVDDYMTIVKTMGPETTVVILDPTRDGIDQIASYLSTKSNLDSISIFSHGSSGNLILGGQTYSESRLAQYQADFALLDSH